VSEPLHYRATKTVTVDENGEAHLALRTTRTTAFDTYAMNIPLVYVPRPDLKPYEIDGPNNSVF